MLKIKIYGVGGQGVITAAKVIARAVGVYENKYVKIMPAYGHEQRGAAVHVDIMISEEEILSNSFVYTPDVVVVLDTMIKEKGIDIKKGTHKSSVLIMNTTSSIVAMQWEFPTTYWVDATGIANRTIGSNIPNIAILGAIAKVGIVSIEAIKESCEYYFCNKSIFKEMVNIAYGDTRQC